MKAVFCFIIISLIASTSWAERRYSCSDGRVQDRPCTVRSSPPSTSARMQLKRSAKTAPRAAEVTKTAFKTLSATRGQWSGIVRGQGRVFVKLLIFRNSNLEESRLMGSVVLATLKSTNFAFRSPLPKGTNWSSRVVAWAEPV